MSSCVVKWCRKRKESRKSDTGITFHCFPKNELRRIEWINAVRLERRQEDWLPTRSSKVCSIHFDTEDMYPSRKGNRMLKKSAVPICTMVRKKYSESQKFTVLSKSVNADIESEQMATEIMTSKVNSTEHAYIDKLMQIQPVEQSTVVSVSQSKMIKGTVASGDKKVAQVHIPQCFITEDLPLPSFTDHENIELQEEEQEGVLKLNTSLNIMAHKHKAMVKCPYCTYEFDVQIGQANEYSVAAKKQKCIADVINMPIPSCSTPISVPSSEIDSVFNSPKTRHLKQQLRRKSLLSERRLSKIKNLQRKNKRLIAKHRSLQHILKDLKKKGYDHPNMEMALGEFPDDIISSLKKKQSKTGRTILKYTPTVKKFALTLNYYSPAAYKYVRRKFMSCLPHPSTLTKWYQVIDGTPGFTEEAFRALKSKFDNKDTENNLFCLMADEMAIRQQKLFNGKDFDGLVTFGPPDETATQVYVLMLVALNGSFKLPLGYFFINGLPAEQRSNLIKICLQKCHEVGAEVVSLTFDGCPSNINMAKQLGCHFEDVENLVTHFPHPSSGKPIVIILDPCHMVKLIRNIFEAKKTIIDKDDQIIKWEHLTALQQLQQNIGLHLGNKLSARHVHFRNNIMNVKLATQTLSNSVATALKLCCNELKMPNFQHANPTITFIETINNLFDVLNCRSLQGKGYKHPFFIERNDDLITFLENTRIYLIGLKINVQIKSSCMIQGKKQTVSSTVQTPLTKTQSKTGFLGLLICISSFKMLYQRLVVQQQAVKYILPYKFSQDHLELFFGVIRNHGRCNNNPNARQFMGIYKKTLLNLELSSKFTGNCIPLEDFPILNCSSVINRTTPGYRQEYDPQIPEGVYTDEQNNCQIMSEMLDDRQLPEIVEQIVGYMSGFVARKLISKLQCTNCTEILTATERLYFHKLICLKSFGGLVYPSVVLYKICYISETILRQTIKVNPNGKSLSRNSNLSVILNKCFTNILEKRDIYTDIKSKHNSHDTLLIKSIIEQYLRIRLHYMAKNDSLINSNRHRLSKLIIFRGM